MTFSIIAYCPKSRRFGAAVASSSPAVAARCIRARAGVGVAASQNITDPALGVRLLEGLAAGNPPEAVMQDLLANTEHTSYRQLAVLDGKHAAAVFSGSGTLGIHHAVKGEHAVCAGNLLANTAVVEAMLQAFEQADGELEERLLIAMQAGMNAGGEAGPIHSAGMLIADRLDWNAVDLRVDWTEEDPITELAALWDIYRPQMASYVRRAENPQTAASFGVPGDE